MKTSRRTPLLICFVILLFSSGLTDHQLLAILAEASEESPYVTTSQYTVFLNEHAQEDLHHLYEEPIENNLELYPIVRLGTPGFYHYESLVGSEDRPINFTSFDNECCYSCCSGGSEEIAVTQYNSSDPFALFDGITDSVPCKERKSLPLRSEEEITRFQDSRIAPHSDLLLKSSILFFSVHANSLAVQNNDDIAGVPYSVWLQSSTCTLFVLGSLFSYVHVRDAHQEYLKTTRFSGDNQHKQLVENYNSTKTLLDPELGSARHSTNNQNDQPRNKIILFSEGGATSTPDNIHFQKNFKTLKNGDAAFCAIQKEKDNFLSPLKLNEINKHNPDQFKQIVQEWAAHIDSYLKPGLSSIEKNFPKKSPEESPEKSFVSYITEKKQEIQKAFDDENYALALYRLNNMDQHLEVIQECMKKIDSYNKAILNQSIESKTAASSSNIKDIRIYITAFISDQENIHKKTALESYIKSQILLMKSDSKESIDACGNISFLHKFIADFYNYMSKQLDIILATNQATFTNISDNGSRDVNDNNADEDKRLASHFDENRKIFLEKILLNQKEQNDGFLLNSLIEKLLTTSYQKDFFSKKSKNATLHDKASTCLKRYKQGFLTEVNNTQSNLSSLFYFIAGFYYDQAAEGSMSTQENEERKVDESACIAEAEVASKAESTEASALWLALGDQSHSTTKRCTALAQLAEQQANGLSNANKSPSSDATTNKYLASAPDSLSSLGSDDSMTQNSIVDLPHKSIVIQAEDIFVRLSNNSLSFPLEEYAQASHFYNFLLGNLDNTSNHSVSKNELITTEQHLKAFYWGNAADAWAQVLYHANRNPQQEIDGPAQSLFRKSAEHFTLAAEGLNNNILTSQISYQLGKAYWMMGASKVLDREQHAQRWQCVVKLESDSLNGNELFREHLVQKAKQAEESCVDFVRFLFCGVR